MKLGELQLVTRTLERFAVELFSVLGVPEGLFVKY